MSDMSVSNPVNVINLPFPYRHLYSWKVRETFDHPDHPGLLFVIATDRVSSLDVIHHSLMPGKGSMLTQLAKFRFGFFKEHETTSSIPSQLLDDVSFPEDFPQELQERTMIVKKLKPIPIEAIVRGYLYGSALKEYEQHHTIAGIQVGKELIQWSPLPEPLFAPSTKAPKGQHDENTDYQTMVHILELCLVRYGMKTILARKYATQIKEYSLAMYKTARDYAATKWLILADTKFEFGFDEEGVLHVIDEAITPDSSRFWKAEWYVPGKDPVAYDKQALKTETARIWQEKKLGKIPLVFPKKIIQQTVENYQTVASLFI